MVLKPECMYVVETVNICNSILQLVINVILTILLKHVLSCVIIFKINEMYLNFLMMVELLNSATGCWEKFILCEGMTYIAMHQGQNVNSAQNGKGNSILVTLHKKYN
jgi:hypothetical protein